MSLVIIGFVGVTTTLLCFLLMPVVSRLSTLVGATDEPEERRVNLTTMPRLGGIAIALSFSLGSLLFLPLTITLIALLAGLMLATLTGVVDDIWQIRPVLKLVGQIGSATVFVLISGVHITDFGDLFGFGNLVTGWFGVPVTVFAMVAVMNAMNLADGLDGLAGGLTVIGCFFILLFAFAAGHWLVVYLLIALIGSLLAFLYFNMHPARIFMGDSGALALGYLLSSICLLLVYDGTSTGRSVHPVSMAIILVLPILDTLIVMLRRLAQGLSPAFADTRHLHHTLMALNLSSSATVSLLYLVMLVFGALAVLLRNLPDWVQFYLIAALATLFICTLIFLRETGLKVNASWLRVEPAARDMPLVNQTGVWLEKTVSLMVWLLPLSLINPVVSFPHMRSSGSLFSFAIGMLVLLLFPWHSKGQRAEWVHGLLYLATVLLLIHLNINGPGWTPVYLRLVTVAVAIWVLLNLIFRQQMHIFRASSFEVLMLMVVWLIPFVIQRTTMVVADQRLVLHACIESIPFLLAMKIMLTTNATHDRYLVIGLASAFMLVGVRQFIAPW